MEKYEGVSFVSAKTVWANEDEEIVLPIRGKVLVLSGIPYAYDTDGTYICDLDIDLFKSYIYKSWLCLLKTW